MKIKGFQDTIDWYNKNANKYAQSIKDIPSVGLEEFIKLIPKGSVVLDVGCGSGRDTKRLVDKGINTIGLDLSTGLIAIAKQTYPDIRFEVGDMLQLHFPDNSIGGIWAYASLLHFETIKEVMKALEEFYRVLKKEGIVHIFVKEKTTEKKFDIVSDKVSGHDRFFQYFTKEEVEKYLKDCGFKVLNSYICDDPAGRPEVRWIECFAKK